MTEQTTIPADEKFLVQAQDKMAALVRLIGEQDDQAFALIVLHDMWGSIENDLRAAITAREAAFKVADETKDLKTLARLIKDDDLLAVAAEYRTWSERFVGILLNDKVYGEVR
jgi:hypothetical protein